ncbi:MAG: hypothetical protein IRZ05_12585, partial [Micromonosporaceae bacterium]|nr:hypothetical protein [Micromonosporaceae bacterium]
MSDLDSVLERLLTDPSFARALAADPASALAGYRLTPEEVALLSSQVSADPGEQHAVETRDTKSGLFGLLAPLAGLAAGSGGGGVPGGGGGVPGGGGGPADHLGSGSGGAVG